MMALKLEVFDTGDTDSGAQTVVLDTMILEETKLAAYEKGYSAGWEDAVAAQSEDQSQIRADLARNLQGLSFTFHEARDHVLRALEPLLTQITTKLLPVLAHDVLPAKILEVVLPMARDLADAPITIVINSAARPAIEALMEHTSGLPISIVEEPSLSEGQVYLRLGDTENQINLDRATQDISKAVRGFFDLPERERKHG
jgi:flagellar biosynthesis/type III secretory pathway protein FliH